MSLWNKKHNKYLQIKNNIHFWHESHKWKRDKGIILFGGWFGERYADTSRYLFQYLSDNKEKYAFTHVVWVTRSEKVKNEIRALGYEAYMLDSNESILFHQKAATHIICNRPDTGVLYAGDIMGYYSYGAHKINLWHGVMPMKGVASASNEYKAKKKAHPLFCLVQEFLIAHSKLYRAFFCLQGGWGDCYFLSVTPAGTDILQKFFLLPRNHYIETGNPRVCGKVSYTEREAQVIQTITKNNKTILYLPTFRESNSSFDFKNIAKPLQNYLQEKNILWIQKAHTAADSATYSNQQIGNILYLSSDFDINTIIKDVSMIVTDFSSVAADAMYYYKPIIYYMPDYDEYMHKDRGFVLDPNSVIVGPQAFNLQELQEEINKTFKSTFVPGKKYLETRLKYWGPDKSMEEIWKDICKAIHL